MTEREIKVWKQLQLAFSLGERHDEHDGIEATITNCSVCRQTFLTHIRMAFSYLGGS